MSATRFASRILEKNLALLCLFLLLSSPILAPLEAMFHQLAFQQPVSLQLVLNSLTSKTNNVQM